MSGQAGTLLVDEMELVDVDLVVDKLEVEMELERLDERVSVDLVEVNFVIDEPVDVDLLEKEPVETELVNVDVVNDVWRRTRSRDGG